MLVLLKNHLNYLKDNIFEWFFRKYNFLDIYIYIYIIYIFFHNI